VFPPVVGYMIAIGEQSGQLEELLDRVAEAYDEEVRVQTEKVTSLIEPLMIVAMAAVVGFIVLSIMQPILKISDISRIRGR
jgi:type II secretory pathway component PulF